MQPKMTEAFYANPIIEEELQITAGSTITYINVISSRSGQISISAKRRLFAAEVYIRTCSTATAGVEHIIKSATEELELGIQETM